MEMTNQAIFRWVRWSLISLLLVAFLGVVMRYKIAYSLPFIQQKNVQHAHSHFAFSGWVTQTLMVLMVFWLGRLFGHDVAMRRYRGYLLFNLLAAYGMLLSFPFQGYGPVSIGFSTASIFVGYAFAARFIRDLAHPMIKNHKAANWFRVGLIFQVISSAGPFALAYMLASKIINAHTYLASVYYFLHFQYNGWFLFACFGLLMTLPLAESLSDRFSRNACFTLTLACIPSYFLSVLWYDLPLWLYVIVIIAAITQMAAWVVIAKKLVSVKTTWPQKTGKILLMLAGLALTVKFLLQLGSVVPALSHIAFEFRPIVIAYLHLVLLGVITIFLIGYLSLTPLLYLSRPARLAITLFVVGIFLNEFVLMLQGIGAIGYVAVPFANESLLVISGMMLAGIFLLILSQRKKNPEGALHI